MDTMINTATTEQFKIEVKWILLEDTGTVLTDKIDYPLSYPLSMRAIRSCIAEHYGFKTSEIKINDVTAADEL